MLSFTHSVYGVTAGLALSLCILVCTVAETHDAVYHPLCHGVQVTPVLCDSVARWQEVVPVAAALRNPVMKDRHWTKMQQELGVVLPLGPAFTLHTLFDLKVTCHAFTGILFHHAGHAYIGRLSCFAWQLAASMRGGQCAWLASSVQVCTPDESI